MRPRLRHLLVLSGALFVGACADAPPESSTESTTRSLLSQPVGDGMSTPLGAAGPGSDTPPVSVATVGFNRGSVDAPLKVVEMSDYGCSFCRQFHEESFPTLRAQFIESGKIEWKFVPYITGMFGNSLPATEAAECTYAQSEQAFEVLNARLWAEQPVWKGSDDPETLVRQWVTELGIDMDTFDGCVASDERVPRIASATTLARQIGVRGTPTFVVIGWPPVQGALPLEMFQDLFNAAYAQAMAEGDTPQ